MEGGASSQTKLFFYRKCFFYFNALSVRHKLNELIDMLNDV